VRRLDILKEIKNPMYKSTTDQGKTINLFNSILDTVARDKQDIPVTTLFGKIDKVKNTKDLQSC
jgi:endothelin-converting enzyme/putative endopeptidase